MTNPIKRKKRLTGKKVFLMVFGFFAVVLASNAYMIGKSVTSFRGEDTQKSYLQGLHYNDTLERRAAQKKSGWRAELDYHSQKITLKILDREHLPVPALTLTGKLRHPTDTSEDMVLEFSEQGVGSYVALLPEETKGQRILLVTANTNEGFEFETRNTLWLP